MVTENQPSGSACIGTIAAEPPPARRSRGAPPSPASGGGSGWGLPSVRSSRTATSFARGAHRRKRTPPGVSSAPKGSSWWRRIPSILWPGTLGRRDRLLPVGQRPRLRRAVDEQGKGMGAQAIALAGHPQPVIGGDAGWFGGVDERLPDQRDRQLRKAEVEIVVTGVQHHQETLVDIALPAAG